jgi:hypothetical protein
MNTILGYFSTVMPMTDMKAEAVHRRAVNDVQQSQ